MSKEHIANGETFIQQNLVNLKKNSKSLWHLRNHQHTLHPIRSMLQKFYPGCSVLAGVVKMLRRVGLPLSAAPTRAMVSPPGRGSCLHFSPLPSPNPVVQKLPGRHSQEDCRFLPSSALTLRVDTLLHMHAESTGGHDFFHPS